MTTQSTPRAFTGAWRALALVSVLSHSALAAVPAGYYDSADTSSPAALRNSLHTIIDDHQRFPYTSSSTDTWDILESADQDPENAGNVIDVYKNASYPKAGGGNSNYNREHSWPKSYGFPDDGSTNYAYTDTHHLFIADSSYNSSRSNKPYASCGSSCTEKTTEFNNGRGGTSSQSNWTAGSFSDGSWETWSGRRGDVARALMYMAVRYEGGTHGVTGVSEPDLILTDDRTLIGNSNQGSNISVAYMGLKSVLIQWHKDDPVDDIERRHNDTVYSFQGNRNPFVDHPEYVSCVFENDCSGGTGGDTTAPAAVTGFSATGGNALVALAWSANLESDLAGYNVYRASSSGGTFTKLNTSLVTTSAYTDTNVSADTTYFYKVAAVDTSSNESVLSAEASATTDPSGGGGNPTPGTAWLNEFHYDNAGSDTGEFVEIAGTAGTDLTGWSLVAYNGNGGTQYKTIALSGTLANQQNGYGFASFAASGLQNGAPDGLALVNASGTVVQFISYEGVMTATNGPASGQASTNVGVSETSSTPVGHSLQLAGSGSNFTDFSWQSPQASTSGAANSGQTLTGGSAPVNADPVAGFTSNCNGLSCSFDASSSSDSDGSIVSYSWSFGDGTSTSGVTANHNYTADGSFTASLTVTDNLGATSTTNSVVTVDAAPQIPAGLAAVGGLQQINVSWNANSESDLQGYNLYRSNTENGSYTKLNTSVLTSSSYQDTGLADATTYFYKVTAVDNGNNESNQSVATSATTDTGGSGGGGENVLENGVAKTALSGAQNEELLFTIEVPAGASNLNVSMSGGSGDADLYLRAGSEPTTSNYDCRPYLGGNNETCTVSTPVAGTYYVKLIGYSSFSSVSLTASYSESGGAQGETTTVNNVSASTGQWQYFTVEVPAGMSSLNVATSGGTGDSDLYVRYGSQPTTSNYSCRPYLNGNDESCTQSSPQAGTWHVGVRAYSTYSGVTLTMTTQP